MLSATYDNKICSIIVEPNPTGISGVTEDSEDSEIIYNLAGQRVGKNYKGIVIKNGKKVVIK